MTDLPERVKRAREWFAAVQPDGVRERDVDLIAALDVTEKRAAERLRLEAPGPLLPLLDNLLAAVKVGTPAPAPEIKSVIDDSRRSRSGRSRREPQPAASDDVLTKSVSSAAVSPPVIPPPLVPTAAGAAPSASTRRADAGGVDLDGFSPLGYENGILDYGSAKPLTFTYVDGTITVSWPEAATPPGETAVYRLVASGDSEPYVPDRDVVAATTLRSAVDVNPRQEPIRFVQVWVNFGADIPAAKRSQPVLHARGLLVMPPSSFDVVANEGQVVGRWYVAADDISVEAMWIEEQLAGRVVGFDNTRLITSIQGGFTHRDAPAGQRIEYRAVARAERLGVDGHVMQGTSPPVARVVETPAVIDAVFDLEIQASDLDARQLDLSWTSPASGSVDVYMINVEPQAGIDRQPLFDRTSLENAGLTREFLLRHPTSRQDGRTWMHSVPWTRTWARAWFVPVTVLNDKMKVGPIRVRTRPPEPVSGLRFIERVDSKLVTFEWPEAVDLVRVYIKPLGVELNPELEDPVAELAEPDYRRFGGIRIPVDLLDVQPAMIHVVSTSHSNAVASFAMPVAVQYPGLRQLRYTISPPEKKKTPGLRGALAATEARQHVIRIRSNATWDAPVRFRLFYHPTMLPISTTMAGCERAYDFEWLPVRGETFERELNLSNGKVGFVRLFVHAPDDEQRRIAILDPPLNELVLR